MQLHYFTEFNAKSIISLILMCSLQIESLLEVSLQRRRNNYANGMQFKLDNSITTKLQAVATYFKSITSMMVHPVWKIIRSTTIYVPLFLPLFSHRIIVAGNKSNLGVVYVRTVWISEVFLYNSNTMKWHYELKQHQRRCCRVGSWGTNFNQHHHGRSREGHWHQMSVREASGNSNAAQGLLDKTPLFGGHDDVDDLTLDEMRLKFLEKKEMYFSLRLLLKISIQRKLERNEVT